jgi:hypothetical protein
MSFVVVSLGPLDPTWFGFGLMAATTGFLLVVMGCGAYGIVSDRKLFRFCGSVGTFALILGFVLIGVASLLPFY